MPALGLMSARLETTRDAQVRAPASGPEVEHEEALVARAVRRDRDALSELVALLRPAIQREITATLRRHSRRVEPAEVLDLTQDVFLGLFDRDAKKLRVWSPHRGRRLVSFVRLVARHHTVSFLRSPRRNPWGWFDAVDPADAGLASTESPGRVEAKEAVERLLDALKSEVTPRSWALFESVFVEESPLDEVCAAFGMSRLALYAWRSRFRRQVRQVADRLGLSA